MAVLRGYSSIYTQESLLAGLGRPSGIPGIEAGSAYLLYYHSSPIILLKKEKKTFKGWRESKGLKALPCIQIMPVCSLAPHKVSENHQE